MDELLYFSRRSVSPGVCMVAGCFGWSFAVTVCITGRGRRHFAVFLLCFSAVDSLRCDVETGACFFAASARQKQRGNSGAGGSASKRAVEFSYKTGCFLCGRMCGGNVSGKLDLKNFFGDFSLRITISGGG